MNNNTHNNEMTSMENNNVSNSYQNDEKENLL